MKLHLDTHREDVLLCATHCVLQSQHSCSHANSEIQSIANHVLKLRYMELICWRDECLRCNGLKGKRDLANNRATTLKEKTQFRPLKGRKNITLRSLKVRSEESC